MMLKVSFNRQYFLYNYFTGAVIFTTTTVSIYVMILNLLNDIEFVDIRQYQYLE